MLRYPAPAGKSDWESALPIGNGRLGAMVYGGITTETLRLNEESVWYGGPQNRTPKSAAHLPRLRDLIRRREHREVEDLVKKHFFATPRSARHYEPLGQCCLEFKHSSDLITEYERCLDLKIAEAIVKYDVQGNKIRRSCIASFPDGVIAIRIEADSRISFSVALTRTSDKWYETNEFLDSIMIQDGKIVMHATPGGSNSNRSCTIVGVQCHDEEGSVEAAGRFLEVTSRDAVVIIGARTSYRDTNLEKDATQDVSSALQKAPDELWQRHRSDWQAIYGLQELHLWPSNNDVFTDKRIKQTRDPGLVALYHNYGRYLLLSCSRDTPHALPATLQGIWNPYFSPPWGAKYTININLQMNYWPVDTGNLSDCSMPLFRLLHRLAVKGKMTAKAMYDCGGWCCHHNTDIWADTDPQDTWMPATLWPLGGAWLCTHIWEHYQFDEDIDFLVWMFPVLQGCVEFLLDFLVLDAVRGYLTTSPSLSPENIYIDANKTKGILCEGSTIDIEIVRTVLDHFLQCIETMLQSMNSKHLPFSVPFPLASRVRNALPRLPPTTISPTHGGIQEWGLNDYEEAEPGHRHVSHLYGLYPGSSITPSSTPDLAAAALKSLRRRLENGGGHTGWSRSWLIGLFARLRKPAQCFENVEALLRESTVPNMMDSHPPVQLDGNWGGCAGILECLIQSHEHIEYEGRRLRIIRLLPSCPLEWSQGSLRGAKARGGFEVDFAWEGGKVKEPITVHSALGYDVLVSFHNCGEDEHFDGRVKLVQGSGRHEIP